MAYPFGPAARMLILTGARREEVGAMRWSEVDLAEEVWTLPAARAKNGVEHVIPLSDAAASILETCRASGNATASCSRQRGRRPYAVGRGRKGA
jgi:integrase